MVPGHHVGPVAQDARHDAEVAEDGHQDYPAQDADLLGNMKTFLDILDIFRYFRHSLIFCDSILDTLSSRSRFKLNFNVSLSL